MPIFNGLVEKDWTADEEFHPIVPGLATKHYVETKKKAWGVDSVLYAVRVRGDFIDEKIGFFCTGSTDAEASYQQGGGTAWRNNDVELPFNLLEDDPIVIDDDVVVPVSYWTMDAIHTSGSAPEVLDPISGHDGTLASPATTGTAEGRNGFAEAYENDGTGTGRATVPDHADHQITGDVTLAAWVRIVSAGTFGRGIVTKAASGLPAGTGYTFAMSMTSGRLLNFAHGDTNVITPSEAFQSTRQLSLSTWHHVAAVRDSTRSTVTLYIDGKRDESGAQAYGKTPTDSATGVSIGTTNSAVNTAMNGRIDELAIFPAVLSDEDVLALYLNSGRGDPYRRVG